MIFEVENDARRTCWWLYPQLGSTVRVIKKETLTDSDEMYFNSAHINMHDASSRQSML